jgi:glyoxylase-like metal-dependent hydrolase (beta-lactamase superfamily II)
LKTRILLAALAVLVLALGWTFVKRPLAVPDTPGVLLPPVPNVKGVSVSVIPTAEIATLHAFNVRGGSFTKGFTSAVAAFLVEHPKGKVLIDAGAAREIDAHLKTIPLLMQAVSNLTLLEPTVDALKAGGLDPRQLSAIWLTHSHWDHVSGLADLRDQVPVWLTEEELEYAWQDEERGKLFRELQAQAKLQIRKHQLTDGAYGPFPWSNDYFGDGSVVLLPLAGHTPGSLGILVNLASGKRYLFIGDTAWAREGVDWPAEKPFLSRNMVDDDPQLVRDQLVLLHKLQKMHPELVIVPAHDARVHAQMAQFPDREK